MEEQARARGHGEVTCGEDLPNAQCWKARSSGEQITASAAETGLSEPAENTGKRKGFSTSIRYEDLRNTKIPESKFHC